MTSSVRRYKIRRLERRLVRMDSVNIGIFGKKVKHPSVYDYLDSILKKLGRKIRSTFRGFRKKPFDELNVELGVLTLYNELEKLNYDSFLDIVMYYYALFGGRSAKENGKPLPMIENMLREYLDNPSEVMKYSYNSEVGRKRDRLVEALLATGGDKKEIDNAMKYWEQTAGQFGLEVADEAIRQSRVDRGIKKVRWECAHDGKTCAICKKLDGKIYNLDKVPAKPHPNCRCTTIEI